MGWFSSDRGGRTEVDPNGDERHYIDGVLYFIRHPDGSYTMGPAAGDYEELR